MTEMPLPLAVQVGVERMNQLGTPFAPYQVRLIADLGMSSELSGVIALPPGRESVQPLGGYQLVKFAAPQPQANELTVDDLWKCAKEHYGLTASAAITGIGGIPINKMHLGHFVMPGSSQYTNLVSHYGHKFFPMAMLPRGSAVARLAKSAFGTIRIFGIVGRTLPFVAMGLAVYDVISIGMCAYEERHGK